MISSVELPKSPREVAGVAGGEAKAEETQSPDTPEGNFSLNLFFAT